MGAIENLQIKYYYNQIKSKDDSSIRESIEKEISGTDYCLYSFDKIQNDCYKQMSRIASEHEALVNKQLNDIDIWVNTLPVEIRPEVKRTIETVLWDRYSSMVKMSVKASSTNNKESIIDIIRNYLTSISDKITLIIKNKPDYTDYTLEVIQIVAPAIAQTHSISLMVIVAVITVMCRKGIMKYINGDLKDI